MPPPPSRDGRMAHCSRMESEDGRLQCIKHDVAESHRFGAGPKARVGCSTASSSKTFKAAQQHNGELNREQHVVQRGCLPRAGDYMLRCHDADA